MSVGGGGNYRVDTQLCDEWRGYKGVSYRVYTRELKEFRLRDEGCTGEIECSRLQCL